MRFLMLAFLLLCSSCVATVNARPAEPKDITDDVLDAVVGLLSAPDKAYCAGAFVDGYYVITAEHCVDDEETVDVGLWRDYSYWRDGGSWYTSYQFRVVHKDPQQDFAVLVPNEIIYDPPEPLRVAPREPQRGQYAVAIGHPLGLEYSISEGRVVAPVRTTGDRLWLQASAHLSPGNSGGPLLNYYGEVIGVASFRYVTRRGPEQHLAGFVHWRVIQNTLTGGNFDE